MEQYDLEDFDVPTDLELDDWLCEFGRQYSKFSIVAGALANDCRAGSAGEAIAVTAADQELVVRNLSRRVTWRGIWTGERDNRTVAMSMLRDVIDNFDPGLPDES